MSDWAREVISRIFRECVDWYRRSVNGAKAEQMLDEAVDERDAAKIIVEGLEAQPVGQHWRPIETAPRDCTWILGIARNNFGRGQWMAASCMRWSYKEQAWGDLRDPRWMFQPQFWMPLPAEPEVENGD